MVWYLLRSILPALRAAAACAAASAARRAGRLLARRPCCAARGGGANRSPLLADAGSVADSSPAGGSEQTRRQRSPTPSSASGSISPVSICEYSATRRVSVENSIALRKAISLRASGSCTASSSSGTSSFTLSSSSTSCREMRAFSAFSISASRRFGCLISPARIEQRFQIAIFDDQLRGGLDADARHARHVVGGIARQRLHLDHLFRRHAEFLDHLGDADAAVLHGVVHGDAVGHELHQVLVGGHDGRGGAALAGLRAHRSRSGRPPRSRPARGRAGRRRAPPRGSAQIAGSGRPAPAAGAPCSRDRSLLRKVISDLSKTIARWVGRLSGGMSRNSFHSMLQKPSTALTCSPSDLRFSGGNAW